MINIGGKIIQTVPLDLESNVVCVGLGMFELVIGLLVKLLPLSWFNRESSNERSANVSPFV